MPQGVEVRVLSGTHKQPDRMCGRVFCCLFRDRALDVCCLSVSQDDRSVANRAAFDVNSSQYRSGCVRSQFVGVPA